VPFSVSTTFHSPVGGLRDVGRAAAADDRAPLAARRGQRHGDAGRVHMAVIGRVQRAQHAIEIVERVQLAHPVGPDQLDVEAQRAADDSVWRSQSISSSV
jgi:hypothetical protein